MLPLEGSDMLTCVIVQADFYAALQAFLDDVQLAIHELIAASFAFEDGLECLKKRNA